MPPYYYVYMENRKLLISFLLILYAITVKAQNNELADTLNNITIVAAKQHYLQDVVSVNLFAGKKTDVITLHGGEANLPQNTARMIFAKIPGINNWDMDGAGTQMNISTRGTDAHRSIEMNMRQNGYNTNSDLFGYPENHFTIPMQAVRQIQLVRGSAALQFGPQFGGMMNYVLKDADTTKVFSLESEQTTGSFNFFNSFNAVGGTKGKVSYYAYYDNRHGDGWRPNSAFNYQTYYASIKYQFNKNGSITFQMSRMNYRQQIAGGLTDEQFAADARKSYRARNYFSPKINIPAIIFNYNLSSQTQLKVTTNGLWGERSSVQYLRTANIADTINTTTGGYNPRQVDRDFYYSISFDARLLHRYSIGQTKAVLATGITYSNSHTRRKQLGTGTTASDFDFSLVAPYEVDLHLHTLNYAAFLENIFRLTDKFSVTPGVRYEIVNSSLDGLIKDGAFPVTYKGNRHFPLFGMGLQYQINHHSQLYGNISQAYRPYLYANITPADQLGIIDPNLKDSKGYDVDLGYRGQISNLLTFDANMFYLFYGNKIGKVNMTESNNVTYLYTTNIGNSIAKGVEVYANLSLVKLVTGSINSLDVRIFNSLAYTHARYTDAHKENLNLTGKHVEGVPEWNEKAGFEIKNRGITTTIQTTHISKQFNDANNTVYSVTGATGVVPSYTLFDWSFQWSFMKNYHIAGGVNNFTNTKYFSRRINMYPGPGILPGDGRSFYVSVGVKL